MRRQPRTSAPRSKRLSSRNLQATDSSALQPPGRAHEELVLYHQPTSTEDLLAASTIDNLNALRLTESWFAEIPSHLGRDPAVDAATAAFIGSNWLQLRREHSSLAKCLKDYVRALERQRKLIESSAGSPPDEAILASAMLAHFERTTGQIRREDRLSILFNTLVHLRSMERMITTRVKQGRANELDYTLVTGHYMLLLEAPLALGVPSPYERLASADPEAILANAAISPARRLRRIASELMLHAPRTIAEARARRSGEASESEQRQAVERALRLLGLRDNQAESDVLHNVRIAKSTSPRGGSSTPLTRFSFTYPTLADFDAALNYWHARLLISRVCWNLNTQEDTFAILEEGRRACTNILMSWDYAQQQSIFGLIRLLHCSCSLWGAISDFDVSSSMLPKNLRRAVFERINELYTMIVGATSEQQLDQMSALYAGGPLEGPLVKLYKQLWPATAPSDPG